MVTIVGAGMAGLLAGNMMRQLAPQIMEEQKQLPNNHSAVLRFRTSKVGDALGIRFRKVRMVKTALEWRNPVADALAYAYKNGGVRLSDRSITAGLTVDDRYIAPPDLIERMARGLDIAYGKRYTNHANEVPPRVPIISTLPMPILMSILRYPDRDKVKFNHIGGVNIKATIADCDAYVSLMVPDPGFSFSRVSITGNEMIVEVPNPPELGEEGMRLWANDVVNVAAEMLGIPLSAVTDFILKRQSYSKIMPVNEDVRKQFMFWATDHHGIYSLGRFATWRPGLLLDDLVHDIERITEWIESKDRYAVARHR
jgi:hypothetical protein